MAPALTAEPLSPKEKLTSTASPSARSSSESGGVGCAVGLVKKPATPTPATATTRITRSSAAAASVTASPHLQQQRSSLAINNKRKSGNAKASNEPMGLSTAPTPHSTTSPNPSTDTAAASTSAVEHNNNDSNSTSAGNSTSADNSSTPKDNSTAQLLADLTINFEETISAEICLRKTLPDVSLGKEPVPPASVLAVATSSTSAGSALSLSAVDEVTKIEIDNIEERLSQLDGNATGRPEEHVAPPSVPVPVQEAPNTPTRPQAPPSAHLESPQPARTQQQSIQQMTPQSTTSSNNFLKDGAAGAVLEDQDIEEVLKALKTFDGGHVNPDTICEFFDEVWEEAAPAAPLPPAPPENVVDVPGAKPSCSGILVSGSNISQPNVIIKQEQRPWQESHAELEQQQHVISRRIEFLLRRMRKLQARAMCRHASEEVVGIMEWSARSSHKAPVPARSSTLTEQEATVLSIVSGRPSSTFWEEQNKHPLPASQMSNVIRHIATAAKHQQICHSASGSSATLAPSSSWYNSCNSSALPMKRPRKNQLDASVATGATPTAPAPGAVTSRQAAGTTGSATGSNTPRADDIVPGYDTYVTNELTHVSGLLHTELREVQNAIDSDATESSSGGESADEMVTYNNNQQLSLPITRRAVWRYSRDRAAIALRWSWLCSQLTDLEMKIRQHSDLYMDLTQSKGEIQLESTAKTSPSLAQPANGIKEEPGSDYLCSRARPLVLSEFRKRKLFQTTNMHTISKKAARPSNIKCGCQWPQVPCTLCTGRTDPTAPRDLVETMMPQNRVALLDAGYHPVLSFASDVSQSVHLEAVARQPDWQYRVMRSQPKAIVKAMWKAERETIASGGVGGQGGSRRSGDAAKRRYIRRKERNNNSNKEAGSGAKAAAVAAGGAGGNGSSSVGGGDSGNAAARGKRQPQHPTGANSSSSLWPDSRQRQRQRHHSPSSTSISALSGAKKARKSATNSSSSNSTQQQQNHHGTKINNHHLNGYGDQWGEQSRSRRNSSPSNSHKNERTSERRVRPIYDINNIVIPYSMLAQSKMEIIPYKEIPIPKWRIVDSDNDKGKHSSDESMERKLSNGCVASKSEELAKQQLPPPPDQDQEQPALQPPKVNGLKENQAVKHNNNNNTNNNNNKNGLVNGNAKKDELKAAEDHDTQSKEDDDPKEKVVKPKLNGNLIKNPIDKTAETQDKIAQPAPEPPLPKRPKLETPTSNEVTKANGQLVQQQLESRESEEEPQHVDEDLSDEAFIMRHQRALLEERRRFETFLKFPWSTRSRANRRVDSRAESSGANTPDPASPAPHLGGPGHDNESIPSPLAYPLDAFNESGELLTGGQARQARRRTTSSKLKDQLERRSTTPDLRESYTVMPSPFEPLNFPLSDEVYQRLLAETYAPPRSMTVSKRAKSKSISSNCDGGNTFTGGSGSRRSSKCKIKPNGQLNGQLNGHPAAAKLNGIDAANEGGISEPEEEEMLLEDEDDDYPKHHLAPLDDEEPSTPDVEHELYDSAIDAYLADPEALEEDMGEDPFEDDDPNDPEWKTRTEGVRSRRI
uniref:Non-specific lethal 1, isoform E n=1 Tax=Drosophila melanogaster TaxID=7227 RepID=E1JIM0_DROME|nr:non-specific lethal 1, isoform E [Drosophila melanogaster]NP_001262613.1 non-specific lethal 1, isoform P [Drosophila melanogaster]ACZ94918.1 non-specific lethal 1, isoform E [Drosophila melanogaster]AGB95993.1 non-specific lethal 1, isoform P [Drosophila melanogaster]|eukprot:NP_001163622.1 non-specific lethal 1, isoform E [Drosophila melanogaster]